ncbi:MAG: hypothetical protein N2258_06450 [Brevinematales bacterium]|nr:hypothetical protein [Brevinematales bacterium]
MKLIDIYNLLVDFYGEQNWWPIIEGRECVYKKEFMERERTDEEIFEIMIGAILTQNTSWTNVIVAIINLKENNIFSPYKISEIENSKLSQLIKSAGYFNQKAKKLKILCSFLLNNKISELKKLSVYDLRQKFLSLWGIGYETADSIVLYGFNKPVFVVDAYTKRIFSRLGFFPENSEYETIRDLFEKNLPQSSNLYKEYHALIVEFGKNLCKKRPLCNNCSFNENCAYLHKNAQSFAQFIQQS